MRPEFNDVHIYIIGLGYVGLPLAVAFSKVYKTTGIDIDRKRIAELCEFYDRTGEISSAELKELRGTKFLNALTESDLNEKERSIFIITVPTPIDNSKKSDYQQLFDASSQVGSLLKKNDIVIYESTVAPGCTEEDCVPILEKQSGLEYNNDFYCGYSPERINPGDKTRPLSAIKKITSGSTPEIAEFVDNLYGSIITAGTHKANSIKVAEAAKLIENCQRDVNISFVNELALIFDRMKINTSEVLEAASTKWNFLKFSPGLVGGHCISVDPYHMIQKAQSLGYYPALIGAGRRINDNMGGFVANKAVKLMIQKGMNVKGAKALIMGITFKENFPDIRNSKVVDIYDELIDYGLKVDVIDMEANDQEVERTFKISLLKKADMNLYDLIILAVPHHSFMEKYKELNTRSNRVIFDIKSAWPKLMIDGSL